jgi:hypothetical protein
MPIQDEMVLKASAIPSGESDEGGVLPEKSGDVDRVANQVCRARSGTIGYSHIKNGTVIVDPD